MYKRQLYISHNLFYDSSRIDLDNDLINNALYANPLLLNSSVMGENNPESYQIQNSSPASGNGFLINGSTDTINYLEHNGGLDYFGNSVSHTLSSNIGAYNGINGLVHVITTDENDVHIYPSITQDYVNISTPEYSGPIQTSIYSMNGESLGIQKGSKIYFNEYKSGTYFCLVKFGDKQKTMKVVKL